MLMCPVQPSAPTRRQRRQTLLLGPSGPSCRTVTADGGASPSSSASATHHAAVRGAVPAAA